MYLPPVAAADESDELNSGAAVRYSDEMFQKHVNAAGLPGDVYRQPTESKGWLYQPVREPRFRLGTHVFRDRREKALIGRRLGKFLQPHEQCAVGSDDGFDGHAIEISHAATVFKAICTAMVLEISCTQVQADFRAFDTTSLAAASSLRGR